MNFCFITPFAPGESCGTLLAASFRAALGEYQLSRSTIIIRGKLRVGKEARRRARNAAGTPPVEKIIPDKRHKPPKHKKSPLQEQAE
jgi:hypothetical protein